MADFFSGKILRLVTYTRPRYFQRGIINATHARLVTIRQPALRCATNSLLFCQPFMVAFFHLARAQNVCKKVVNVHDVRVGHRRGRILSSCPTEIPCLEPCCRTSYCTARRPSHRSRQRCPRRPLHSRSPLCACVGLQYKVCTNTTCGRTYTCTCSGAYSVVQVTTYEPTIAI